MSPFELKLIESFNNFVSSFETGGFALVVFILFVALVSFILGKNQGSNRDLQNKFANAVQKLEGVFGKLQRIENSLSAIYSNSTKNLETLKEQTNKSYERIKKIYKILKNDSSTEEEKQSQVEDLALSKLFEDTIVESEVQTSLPDSKESLEKNKTQSFWQRLKNLRIFNSSESLDPYTIKEKLLLADCGVELADLVTSISNGSIDSGKLKANLESFLVTKSVDLFSVKALPRVFLFVGVNGSGKTSSLAKLAKYLKENGKKVLTVAADTFRAGAEEQLLLWSKKIGVHCFANTSADKPQTVVFDAIKLALNEKFEFVLIDTAGRLHNKTHLMQELGGISKVISKQIPDQPEEIFLVLDATTGQTAFAQAKEFSEIVNVTSIILTKLDCAAKGGVVLRICKELKIPISFASFGEDENSLALFDSSQFVNQLIG